ncbi:major facilitator superfamily domain-containing protein [Ilyonectria robusta]|uniref:major facilitator superfamily domain-containing protein n=1 Tax=Ilyonectria robusta TaxID=1079257 RepID=UPI001E8EF125|nr:major facilitator superfamily domain-containing protein [Ilyonectria robusta]KAH8729492.1 major facilitator superfamily domain-containing protein [Ilyonectria robusta]
MIAKDDIGKNEKSLAEKDEALVETGSVDEPVKSYYSKVSVWLMILFSGLAIGSDGYNAAVIGNVELLLAIIYPDALTSSIYSRLSNAFLIGMILGMLFFGFIVDQLGRKTGAVATTIILVVGIAMSAAANGATPTGLFWMLIIARGVAGVGAGGEYPVSGAGAAEATDESGEYRKRRGFMFAMLADLSASLGYVWGGLVPLLLLLCVGQKEEKYGIVWRTSFALGAVPPLVIFWFRLRMAVATAYRKSSMRKQRVPYKLALKRYWRPLVGVASCWFLYNWISIPFGIFSSTIMSRANVGDSLVKNLGWGVVINCFYLPGPFLGGYLSDKIGRRQTMALGFSLQAILGFVLGGAMGPIQNIFPLFVVLYGIFLTLGEVGPGSTVVLLASECFPTSIRGQMLGFIAACSKAGAAIGTQVFTAILNSYDEEHAAKGNQTAFLIGSAFAVLGAVIAYFVIPDVSTRLEDDDAAWKAYLAENGWEATWGDAETKDPRGVIMDRPGN